MATFTGTGADEIITPTFVSPTVTASGGAAPGAGADLIIGLGGDDILDGGEGADTIDGGAGDDTILGSEGADAIDGGAGIDTLSYASSSAAISTPLFNSNPLSGGDAEGDRISNIEIIIGSAFNDRLESTGASELHGGAGNDTLVARGNIDLFGEDGDDLFGLNPNNSGRLGDAIFDGGAGFDQINISVAGTEDFRDNTIISIERLNFLNLQGESSFTFAASQIEAFESIKMRSNGGSGDLAVHIVMGDQTTLDLSGKVQFGTADDRFVITGDADGETITGSRIDDEIDGGGGNDVINGGGGADTIEGGDGNDTFEFLPDQDVAGASFDGGAGDDRILLLTAGDGQHVYDLTGATLASIEEIEFFADGGGFVENTKTVSLSAAQIGGSGLSSALLIDGNDSSNSKDLIAVSMGGATSLDLSGWTFQQWGAVANGRNGDGEFIAITGDGDAETIIGSSERDVIEGGGGGDTIDGGDGSDTASYAGSASAVTINLEAGAASGGDADGDGLTSIENLIGSANADTLTGDGGDNIIEGGAGADTLDGGSGNDTLSYAGSAQGVTIRLGNGTASGGDAEGDTFVNFENVTGSALGDVLDGTSGDNILHGGDGNDNLVGRGGADQLFGEGGDDRFSVDIRQEATGALFDGGAGINTLFINSAAGAEDFRDDTFVSVQKLQFDSGFDNDYEVTFLANQFNFSEVGANNATRGNENLTINIDMGSRTTLDLSGIAMINMTSATDNFVITGDESDETITGSAIADTLSGGDGDDTLIGRDGGDSLDGGAGDDTASYEAAAAGVAANLFNANVNSGDAAGDRYSSIESLLGSNLGDALTGDGGDNTLSGGGGNDVLIGGSGGDFLDGGAGHDTAAYRGPTGVTARLDNAAANTGQAAGDSYSSIEELSGTAAADLLVGNADDNILRGGGGNDVLIGGSGGDFLDGGAGHDTAAYRSATGVTARLDNAGANIGDAAGDSYFSIEELSGTSAADVLGGNAGDNILRGGGGDDVLIGGAGGDFLDGGAGADTASYLGAAIGVTARLDTPAANSGDAAGDGYFSIENLTGSGHADTLAGNGNANLLFGHNGADTLSGNGGNDYLIGGNGGDVLDGGGDNDTLRGLNDDDTLSGNAGADRLFGDAGNDLLIGGAGADDFFVYPGGGVDTVSGFEDDLDDLVLNEALWGGGRTAQQVVDDFAVQTNAGHVTFDFGGGDMVLVAQAGITTTALVDDIVLF